jgi:ferredoxin/DNA-binding transcriptional MerR regulator
MQSYLAALDATGTSLHLINTGMRPAPDALVPLNAWLVAGAAIESRAHPFFRVDPASSEHEVAPLVLDENPEPEADWPQHPFSYLDDDGNRVDTQLAFTFADYCLLIGSMREHFRVIPSGCEAEALIPIQDWLAMDGDEAHRRVPFLWGLDGSGVLVRLVVSRQLAMACLDRLHWWRTLQSMAGVRNRHVQEAIARTQAEERASADAERERLLAEHAAEVERVRREAAGEAMQRLTDMLLGMDFGADAGPFSPGGAFRPAPAAAAILDGTAADGEADDLAAEAEPATETAEAEVLSFDEPWIDTPLCTSCNDCLKINPLLFVYNEEKQALLGDLNQATYAQLVQAAELCPAKCIHPGKPWNPDEPDLEALMERAAPLQ